jgi:hypothetical protein
MIVTAWKNGTPSLTGAGYGVKLAADDYEFKEVKTYLLPECE